MKDRNPQLALAAISLAAFAIPLAIGLRTGSAAIPVNDDWSYGRAALLVAQTGHIHTLPWGTMTLVGHLLWAQPFLAWFGHDFTALRVSEAVAAALVPVSAYAIARNFGSEAQ